MGKKVFDVTVGPDGEMYEANISDFLNCFYRARTEGPTLSGGYVPLYPPAEERFLSELCGAGPVPFAALMEALMTAQENYTEPEAPLEYNSNALMCNDKIKHTRRVLGPQQQFRKPMTTHVGDHAVLGRGAKAHLGTLHRRRVFGVCGAQAARVWRLRHRHITDRAQRHCLSSGRRLRARRDASEKFRFVRTV